MMGRHWLPARRFPVVQAKVRPVDDFSQFGVNSAFGASEKVTMLGLDHIVGWSRAWASSVDESRSFQVYDTAGSAWKSVLHPGWADGQWTDLVGRVADLKSAYKQLPRHVAHSAISVIAVPDTDQNKVGFFKALSLMFGETAAVYAFLRFSRAISALCCSLLNVVCVEFFDDFSQLEPLATSPSAMVALEGLLELLGWTVSAGDKRKPFEKSFVSLGVVVDLSGITGGDVVLSHKPGRIDAIRGQVDEIVAKHSLTFKDALSLRGKIYFSEGQMYGRVAAPVVHMLSRWSAFLALPLVIPLTRVSI